MRDKEKMVVIVSVSKCSCVVYESADLSRGMGRWESGFFAAWGSRVTAEAIAAATSGLPPHAVSAGRRAGCTASVSA
jgi:hypothetical protein